MNNQSQFKIQIQGISKSFGSIHALDDVTMNVNANELMVVMGPSGSGKSTLLLTILGAIPIDKGHIIIDGRSIEAIPMESRLIGYVPQDFGLFPHFTVEQNIGFGLLTRHVPPEVRKKKVGELLEIVDLVGLESRMPSELSGGQKQRVSLARALAINPSLLLLDEPLSSIDESTKDDVRKNLKSLLKRTNATTICITHNPEDAFDLGDRITILQAGKIMQCDTPADLLKTPANPMIKKLIAPMYYLFNEKKG